MFGRLLDRKKSIPPALRPLGLALTAFAAVLVAAPAWAVPVYVTPRVESGPVGADLPVVAFSFDVKHIFPPIEARFDQWRPVPPASVMSNANKSLPNVPYMSVFHLVQATELQDYREAFSKAHMADKEMLRVLMPRFDAVYRKYGDREPEQTSADLLATENSRTMWCKNVTHDLNAIINAYNAGIGGGDQAAATYRETYARWLGKRNEALRQAVVQLGGNSELGYVQSTTNEAGLATFDLPPGRWFIACQLDAVSWYKPVIVPEGGGRVLLRPEEATHEVLNLPEWTGN